MKWLIDLFKGGNPIAETIKAIDGITTSGAERIALKKEFITQIVDAQAQVLAAEAQSKSWLPAGCLPICVFCLVGPLS